MRFEIVLLAATLASAPPQMPDAAFTPGVPDPAVTQANIDQTICRPGYTARVRDVSAATKAAVFREYGIDPMQGGPYEVDHLISLELGGSNAIANLWPQSYVTPQWNAHTKDALENRLHKLVCQKTITLTQAQEAIAHDWKGAYLLYIGPTKKGRPPKGAP